MKRLITLLLALVMVAGLVACNKGETPQPQQDAGAPKYETLHVGFGKAKIQPPDLNIVLTGGGDPNRYVENVLDFIYVTCIAITDTKGETALFYTNDLQSASQYWTIPAREFISEKTGVPTERIYMAATHTHSVPGLSYGSEANKKFCEVYEQGLVQATEDALADRSPSEIYVGTADGYTTDGKPLNFVRHYTMNDGSVAGDNFGDWKSGIKGHPYEGDNQAQLIKFTREDKKDVLMISWPTHATFNGTTALRNLSADYPGPTRDHIEANSDCLVAIFAGAGGDQEPDTLIPAENHRLDYRKYGAALGQVIVDALPSMQKVGDGDIKTTEKVFTSETQKFYDEDILVKAKDVYDYFLENGQAKGTDYAIKNGFMSPYQARAYLDRSKLADTKSLNMQVLSLGDVSFVIAPYEMFSQSGIAIMEGSPFEKTLIIGYCNGSDGYISTPIGYEYNGGVGCYEAYSSPWPKGTAEKLVDEYVAMLTQLKNS